MEISTSEKSDKHQRILDAALTLFHQKGYEPVSLDEIAREAGIAKGTLYLYFRDKDDLFSSAIRHVLHITEETLLAAIEGIADPFQMLERAARANLEMYAQHRRFFGLFFIISNPTLVSNRRELFREMMHSQQALLERLAQMLRDAQKRGLIQAGFDPRELASLFASMIGDAVRRIGFPHADGDLDIPATVDTLMAVFRHGVESRANLRSEES